MSIQVFWIFENCFNFAKPLRWGDCTEGILEIGKGLTTDAVEQRRTKRTGGNPRCF